MRKLLILMAAIVMVFGTMGVANALTVDWSDLTVGSTSASGTGWEAFGYSTGWTNDGVFQTKTVGSVTGVGIAGGNVNGEIDWKEKIRINFDAGVVISEIELSFLYPKKVYNDWVYETALIWVGDADGNAWQYDLSQMLTATGSASAVWNGAGSVENLEDAIYGEGALWRLYDNPFGDAEVTWIAFLTPSYAIGNPGGGGSDYSFVSLSTAAVPIPGALWLLGSGLVGLVGLRRKFSS